MKNKRINVVLVMLFSVEGTPNRENISIRASDLCLILFELTLMHKHNESTVFKTLHGQVVREPDLKSGDHRFKSCSDQVLSWSFFSVDPSSTPLSSS